MSKYAFLSLVCVVQIFISCSFDEKKELSFVGNQHFTLKNTEKIFLSKLGDDWLTETIIIDKDLSYEVGSFFDGYQFLDSLLLLTDRMASQISIINAKGELITSLTHPNPGYDRYSSIGSVDVWEESSEIAVFDDERQKLDVFSSLGDFKKSLDVPMTFWDYGVLENGANIYSVENINLSEYLKGKNEYFRFYVDGNEKKFHTKMLDLSSLATIPIQDFGQFADLDGVVQFRSPLSDTIYVFDQGGNPSKTATFEFTYLNEFKFVSKNKDIVNKADYLFDKKIPCPEKVIFDSERESLFCIFWEGGRRFFIQTKNGNQVNKPSSLYNIAGTICKAPKFYENGVFFQQMYKYEYDYLQSLAGEVTIDREKVVSDLKRLRNKHADESDIVIVMNRYKPNSGASHNIDS